MPMSSLWGRVLRRAGSRPLAAMVVALALLTIGSIVPARAQGTLAVVCSVQADWCQALASAFEKKTGTKVAIVQKGSGEALAQIRAERDNPKLDLWFGGTGDPHLVVAEEGLTEPHDPPALGDLQQWAVKQWEAAKKRTIGIYAGALGFGFNPEWLAKRKVEAPKCWSDLLRPEFKGEIQMANPNSSGTAYTMIATIVQLMGEEAAFAYMKKLHPGINAYTKSGTAPIKAVARGETGVSISFVHDAVVEANAGLPAAYATPCEGTGYEIGSMSIVKGARNLAAARAFYAWALTPEAQRMGFEVAKQLQMPSHKGAPLPPKAPDLSQMKLIAYDFVKYGAAAERKRLLDRWNNEIGALAR